MIKGLVVAFVGLLATGYGHPTERSDNGLELEKKQTPDGYGSSLVTVGSGLTIITHNDLYGKSTKKLGDVSICHAEFRVRQYVLPYRCSNTFVRSNDAC